MNSTESPSDKISAIVSKKAVKHISTVSFGMFIPSSALARSPMVLIPNNASFLFVLLPTYRRSATGSDHAFCLNSLLYIVVIASGMYEKQTAKIIPFRSIDIFENAVSAGTGNFLVDGPKKTDA